MSVDTFCLNEILTIPLSDINIKGFTSEYV